jgi:anti-sigma factor RsiW
MNDSECDRLEAYLDGCLPEQARAAFDRHLSQCPRCQHELRELRRIGEWLASADDELGAVPQHLAKRIAGELRSSRWVVRRWSAIGAAAAAVLLSVVGAWWKITSHQSHERQVASRPNIGQPGAVARDTDPLAGASRELQSQVRLTFERDSDAIVVPIKSQDPDVSIFWIYSTEPEKPNVIQTD